MKKIMTLQRATEHLKLQPNADGALVWTSGERIGEPVTMAEGSSALEEVNKELERVRTSLMVGGTSYFLMLSRESWECLLRHRVLS